ncbi:hypothetical protein GCM10009646_88990 [Streptomyces aureus]
MVRLRERLCHTPPLVRQLLPAPRAGRAPRLALRRLPRLLSLFLRLALLVCLSALSKRGILARVADRTPQVFGLAELVAAGALQRQGLL